MRWLKGELLQQQQEKQGLDSSHSSGEPGLGWSNMKVLNSVLWSLWKIKCNNHLRVWNSKADCCVVSENRQLDQTSFNACIFFLKRLSEDSLDQLCSFFLNFQLKERLFPVSLRVHKYKSHPPESSLEQNLNIKFLIKRDVCFT